MIVIDNLKFNVIIPDILIEYLNNKGLNNVFNIIGDNYVLRSDVSEKDMNIILNACLHFIGNDVGQFVLEDEEMMSEFNKINIFYADRMAADLYKRGNVSRANEILKNKIDEIENFKNNIILKEEDMKKSL